MLLSLLLASVPFLPQTQRPLDVLRNGSFEKVLETGTLGSDPTPGVVDGANWLGAEGRTTDLGSGGTNRYLRLSPFGPYEQPALVAQRLGVPPDQTDSARIEARIRLQSLTDEAHVTLTETDGRIDSLEWQLQQNQLGLPPGTPWRFFDFDGSSYTPLAWNPTTGRYESQTTPASGNSIAPSETVLSEAGTHSLVVGWRAPKEGRVRVLTRPYRKQDMLTQQPDLEYEILVDTDSPTTGPAPLLLQTGDVLDREDRNGTIFSRRVIVRRGTWVLFRLNVGPAPATLPARLSFHPYIAYEGRRLTYRVTGPAGANNPPPLLPNQVWIDRVVPNVGWHQFNDVAWPAFDAGADFVQAFGAAPRAPLVIELATSRFNSANVDFDKLKCEVDWNTYSEPELRTELLREVKWARANWRLTRDRAMPGTPIGNGQLGAVATPWTAHPMTVRGGPVDANPSPGAFVPGRVPPGIWPLLDHAYNKKDYEDYYWIHEQLIHNATPAGLFGRYDANNDVWVTTGTVSLVQIRFLLEQYVRTNDIEYLDIAFNYANLPFLFNEQGRVAANDPVYSEKQRLLHHQGYERGTGVLSTPDPDWGAYENMLAPAMILRTYAACRAFNEAHPSIVPERYPTATLNQWRAAAAQAVQRCIELRSENPDNTWGGRWQAYHGQFNDVFGYSAGRHATTTLDALEPFAQDAALQPLIADLENGIVLDGCAWFFDKWEQGFGRSAYAAGDHTRAWPAYLRTITRNYPSPQAQQYEEQLLNATYSALAIQFADPHSNGIWTGASISPFQVPDMNGAFGTPVASPSYWLQGVAYALQLPAVQGNPELRTDLLARVVGVFETTTNHFKVDRDDPNRELYGYWPTARRDLDDDDPIAGWEARTLNSYLDFLPLLEDGLPEPPSATIEPASLTPASGGNGTTFTFTIQLPSANNPQQLSSFLNTRTKVVRWAETQNGRWEAEGLWPEQANLFEAAQLDVAARTVTLTLRDPVPAGVGTFKFTLRTWDAADQWSRDTSYQEW